MIRSAGAKSDRLVHSDRLGQQVPRVEPHQSKARIPGRRNDCLAEAAPGPTPSKPIRNEQPLHLAGFVGEPSVGHAPADLPVGSGEQGPAIGWTVGNRQVFQLALQRLMAEGLLDEPGIALVTGAAPVDVFADQPGKRAVVARRRSRVDGFGHGISSRSSYQKLSNLFILSLAPGSAKGETARGETLMQLNGQQKKVVVAAFLGWALD